MNVLRLPAHLLLQHHLKFKERDAKENTLINKAQAYLVRRRFSTVDELKAAVYASLVTYLIEKEIIRTGPFDATLHPSASLEDIDEEKVRDFVRVARTD